jgi:TRAP-type C4-dicarboxylate transport system permease small subunit
VLDVFCVQLLMQLAEGPRMPCAVPMWTIYGASCLVLLPIMFRFVQSIISLTSSHLEKLSVKVKRLLSAALHLLTEVLECW